MMRRCELCKSIARVYCDSDRASLCWSCDARVHSANFLVARHLRNLLCHICQSPTPWSASGEKLFPSTASVCRRCDVDGVSDDENDRVERVGGNDGEIGTDSNEKSVDELEFEDSGNENDNQVVPWSSTPPPPPAASSSSGEEVLIGDGGVLLKRKRQNVSDLTSENQEDELDCSSVNVNHHTPSSPMPELASEDEMTSFHSTLSNSRETGRKLKRISHRNVISGDYTSDSVRGTSKSTRNVQIDLNLPAPA